VIGEETFRIWCRSGADPERQGPLWSQWTKPVLFVEMNETSPLEDGFAAPRMGPPATGPSSPAADGVSGFWAPDADPEQALIVDIPGEEAILYGVRLARLGYWPVPLFNGCPGPKRRSRLSSTLDVRPMMTELLRGAGRLRTITTHPLAPPAFLLDSRRIKGGRPAPGEFDNRWVVLPQDFPSAAYLATWNIRRALLIQTAGGQPQSDLAHVLRRWQNGGIRILVKQLVSKEPPRETQVTRPSWFRSVCRVAGALMGLRRNSTGGFGAPVPIPSESSGSGGFGGRFG